MPPLSSINICLYLLNECCSLISSDRPFILVVLFATTLLTGIIHSYKSTMLKKGQNNHEISAMHVPMTFSHVFIQIIFLSVSFWNVLKFLLFLIFVFLLFIIFICVFSLELIYEVEKQLQRR